MIICMYYHCTSDNALLLLFLLIRHPYIPFHFMKINTYVGNTLLQEVYAHYIHIMFLFVTTEISHVDNGGN